MNSFEKDKLLKDLGLNNSEINIYTGLLKLGPSSYASLVNMIRIPRTTIIENIGRLVEKGLVVETVKESKKMFQAEDPVKIKLLLVDKRLDLESKLKRIDSLELKLPSLIASVMSGQYTDMESGVPTIKIYKGKRKVWNMYEDTQKSKVVYSFCDIDKYYEVFPNSKDSFTAAFNSHSNRRVFDILLDTPLAKEISIGHPNYYVKFLPKTSFFAGFVFGDYMIFDGKVALVQLDSKNPSVVIIESQDIYLGFVGLHKTMWELL